MNQTKGNFYLHNVRFYTIKPRAIVCMAYSKALKCLAVSREESSIELWDMRYAPYLDRVIQFTDEVPEVEALAWAGERLFSASLSGKLIEWDLNTLQPRNEHSPTGGALWCLDVNGEETELAVGSEEGHINIMSIENEEINYKTLFTKQNGRVLCCKFDKPGKRLVTGSMGAVRIWNVLKGTTLHTMTLSNKFVAVYSLLVLSNNTIIAGDSAGYVTVWNSENATQLEANKVLDRNIFAMTINEQEDRLVCSGNHPPLIRVLSKTQIKREDSVCERWIKFLQRESHKHLVKSLVVVGDNIISGGLDGMLCISSISKTQDQIAKHAPFLPGPCAHVAPGANLLLLRYPRSVHLWSLGSSQPNACNHRVVGFLQSLQLVETPDKLIQFDSSRYVQASAISPDGKWICYSTDTDLRLSRLEREPKLKLERITEDLPAELEPASHIFFNASEQLFLIHTESRQLRCFDLKNDQVEFLYSVNLSPEVKAPIRLVELSANSKYLAVATSDHLVAVWQLAGNKSKHLLNLPRNQAGTTALAMHEKHPRLVVAYASGHVVDYDLLECRYVCETTKHLVPNSKTHCIKGFLLDAKKPKIIKAYNEAIFYVLKAYKKGEASHSKAKRLSNPISKVNATKPMDYRLESKLVRPFMVQALNLNSTELVTVGIQMKNLVAPLPPPYQRKRFGEA